MKKKVTKHLSRIASTMPVVFRHATEKHIMTGEEMIKETEFKEVGGKPILPSERYVVRQPVQIAVNHKKQLKNFFKKYGPAGAEAYIKAVDNHVNSNN